MTDLFELCKKKILFKPNSEIHLQYRDMINIFNESLVVFVYRGTYKHLNKERKYLFEVVKFKLSYFFRL